RAGRMIGTFGDAEVFSFHATKFFNTFEGGAVTTNDDDLAATVRLMRNFGFSGLDRVVHIGTNGKMSEISAAMGLTGLESLEDVIDANRATYQQYQEELSEQAGLTMTQYAESERNNYQYIILEIDEAKAAITRDFLISLLHAERVRARRYFYPGCHRMEPYRSNPRQEGLTLPETEKLCRRVMSLPNGTAVSRSDIGVICGL